MLPESMAPPLEHYDEFKAFMAERGIRVMREYIPPGEDEETGEVIGDFWTVVMSKEEQLPDGRIYAQCLDIGERSVASRWDAAWAQEAELLDVALRAGIERESA
jgi:hypothetical protein